MRRLTLSCLPANTFDHQRIERRTVEIKERQKTTCFHAPISTDRQRASLPGQESAITAPAPRQQQKRTCVRRTVSRPLAGRCSRSTTLTLFGSTMTALGVPLEPADDHHKSSAADGAAARALPLVRWLLVAGLVMLILGPIWCV